MKHLTLLKERWHFFCICLLCPFAQWRALQVVSLFRQMCSKSLDISWLKTHIVYSPCGVKPMTCSHFTPSWAADNPAQVHWRTPPQVVVHKRSYTQRPSNSAAYCQKNDANIRALAGGGGRIIEGMQVRTSGGTVGRRRPLPHLSWWILPANDSKGRHEKADHRQRGALFRLTLFMYMSDRLSASEANGPPGGISGAWTAEITMCFLLKERFYI